MTVPHNQFIFLLSDRPDHSRPQVFKLVPNYSQSFRIILAPYLAICRLKHGEVVLSMSHLQRRHCPPYLGSSIFTRSGQEEIAVPRDPQKRGIEQRSE